MTWYLNNKNSSQEEIQECKTAQSWRTGQPEAAKQGLRMEPGIKEILTLDNQEGWRKAFSDEKC